MSNTTQTDGHEANKNPTFPHPEIEPFDICDDDFFFSDTDTVPPIARLRCVHPWEPDEADWLADWSWVITVRDGETSLISMPFVPAKAVEDYSQLELVKHAVEKGGVNAKDMLLVIIDHLVLARVSELQRENPVAALTDPVPVIARLPQPKSFEQNEVIEA